MNIGFIIYLIAGYWATGETIYANKVVFYTGISFFITRLAIALLIGWILIPAAIIKRLLLQ